MRQKSGKQFFTAHMRLARQSGGKTLFAAFDTTEPAVPKPACLSGTRNTNGSHLTWKAPDNGGSDIAYYRNLSRNRAWERVFPG